MEQCGIEGIFRAACGRYGEIGTALREVDGRLLSAMGRKHPSCREIEEAAAGLHDLLIGGIEELLLTGEWRAQGFRVPVASSGPEVIPAPYWRFLEISADGRRASGGGITYVGLSFSRAGEAEEKRTAGRPNKTERIREEYARRKASGELAADWEAEIEALMRWQCEHFSDAKDRVKRSTIKQHVLERDFNQARAKL